MALSITDLKKGTVFQLDRTPYKVLEYSQKVMGRGGSTVNVKIKSLADGKVLAKTFHGGDQVDSADISYKTVQYLYGDGSNYFFMDPGSYEQYELPVSDDPSLKDYLKDGDSARAQFFDGRLIGIELPKNLPLKVIYTENAVKGDTSSAITKEAEVETGLKIKVPAFIKTGDIISVDTENGTYRERAKA